MQTHTPSPLSKELAPQLTDVGLVFELEEDELDEEVLEDELELDELELELDDELDVDVEEDEVLVEVEGTVMVVAGADESVHFPFT